MTAATRNIRFMTNNFIGDDILTSVTSEASGFPVENIYDERRSKPWVSAGYFLITATNGTFYFNDGSARTAVVTPGAYTAATLATAIAAAAVASGATATVVASAFSTAPYVWKLTFNISVTLSLNTATNSIWDVLGYLGASSRTGTSFVADAGRAHTVERIVWDMGLSRIATFFGLADVLSSPWSVSETATVKIMANSVNDWAAATLSVTLDQTDAGAMAFLDSIADTEYRFWALEITDRENTQGTAGIRVGYAYLGDHLVVSTTSVASGFEKAYRDPSTVQLSESGVPYANVLTPLRSFSSCEIQHLVAAERRLMEQAFYELGLAGHFFVSLDPMLEVSEAIEEYTFYARMDAATALRHIKRDYYNVSFSLIEAV